ncbi:DUF4198 domain containing protein [Sulfitobacter noctilucae]|uniref:DUF4198 domain-containing protein n=1 Tax=Sulfitobacter noctilucae TaxID=1342302 RepID=UPI000469DD26|nr:DUF4198 domain-containing protein [Sulfitobacter noctilucae]KIN74982.1 DUF4198 domain containing protein [Sulfitobacter noctilucae]
MPYHRLLAFFFVSISLDAAQAHEVWIEPLFWQVPVEESFEAHRINGENFKGNKLSWNERVTVLAERRIGDKTVPLTGRAGDIPAFQLPGAASGLMALIFQSTHNTITYRNYDKFARFVTSKGYEETLDAHAARDLPETPIKEAYVRFAKALVAVGDGAGEDKPRGLELELVALDNPYTSKGGQLRFQVLYRDVPLADNKVTVFMRDAEGVVNELSQTTTADGIAIFDAVPGREYLVDTVVLREPARALVVETKGAVWESLWASLTFKVPDAQ